MTLNLRKKLFYRRVKGVDGRDERPDEQARKKYGKVVGGTISVPFHLMRSLLKSTHKTMYGQIYFFILFYIFGCFFIS